jgi:hypothetical protein
VAFDAELRKSPLPQRAARLFLEPMLTAAIPLAALPWASKIYLRTVIPLLHSSKESAHMASEGTRQGANHDRKKGAVDEQARLGKGGIQVSPDRMVIIRDGQFVKPARRRSNAP